MPELLGLLVADLQLKHNASDFFGVELRIEYYLQV
jgi:hypothetical protein